MIIKDEAFPTRVLPCVPLRIVYVLRYNNFCILNEYIYEIEIFDRAEWRMS